MVARQGAGRFMSRDEGCPVCLSCDVLEFLRRDSVPVGQNVLTPDLRSAWGVTRGRLHLRVCRGCGFIFNGAFEPEKVAYGGSYDNNQNCSPAFSEHVTELVSHLVEDRGVRRARIVEVGCGDGSFLKRLVGADAGNTGVGFDLSYRGPAGDLGGRARFVREQFGPGSGAGAANAVVCRHVIEHVPDPVALLRSVARAAPGARAFFETPDVEWIIRRLAVWDFFYEHCSYFSAGSLATAFERAGFRVVELRRVFRGQYLWVEAEAARGAGCPPPARAAGSLPALAEEFGAADRLLVGRWRTQVERLAAAGGVALWGAGAKGVTFANLVDPDRRLIDCLVDIYPVKQGKYVPGTGHPIVAPAELAGHKARAVLLMNPNYYGEVAAALAASRIEAALIDLTEWAVEDSH
jgi:SAM-dependent methyltransferase